MDNGAIQQSGWCALICIDHHDRFEMRQSTCLNAFNDLRKINFAKIQL